jgi:hypothetical protein
MSRSDEPVDPIDEEESLPPSSTVCFLHAVGQSTIRQGMAVPVIAQIAWLSEIQKGQAVPVTIVFGDGQSVPATLRRINNARGHLQFRYESKKQAPLRNYLTIVFGGNEQGNGVLRVTEVKLRVFLFEPVSAGRQAIAVLSLCTPHFHNCTQVEVGGCHEFKELERCMTAIRYNEEHNQSHYNREIASALSSMGWKCESRILTEIGLRCDFEKNGVWVEVEFGNARVYYQNYIKFLLALRHRTAKVGILLCPTNAFAQLLCDLGQRRASIRTAEGSTHRPSYSGMMSYEKAMRELPFLKFILTGSIVIAGIEIHGGLPQERSLVPRPT